MKTSLQFFRHIPLFLLIGLFATTCHKAQVPLRGSFQSTDFTFLIREKSGFMKYKFNTAKASVSIIFKENNQVSFRFADRSAIPAEVKVNKGNTEKNGIAYIIDCGKVSARDTTGTVREFKLEIWIKTVPMGDTLQAELRQMEFMDAFPMGEITLVKP